MLLEDDTFVIVKDRVREFCQRLIDTNLDLSWSCLGRADRVGQRRPGSGPERGVARPAFRRAIDAQYADYRANAPQGEPA